MFVVSSRVSMVLCWLVTVKSSSSAMRWRRRSTPLVSSMLLSISSMSLTWTLMRLTAMSPVVVRSPLRR